MESDPVGGEDQVAAAANVRVEAGIVPAQSGGKLRRNGQRNSQQDRPPGGGAADIDTGGEERRLTRGFFAAVGTGFTLALVGVVRNPIASVIGFGGPLIVVCVFFLWGFRGPKFQDRSDLRQKFADSCYFLGFLFTMFALMAGFLPAGLLGRPISSQEILRFFGMALGATAFGLVGRIVALQAGRSVDEDAAEVEAELHRYARRVRDEARSIADELATVRMVLNEALAGVVEAVGQPLKDATGEAASAIRTSAKDATMAIKRQSAAVETATIALLERIETRRKDLSEAVLADVAAREGLAGDAAALGAQARALGENLDRFGSRAGESVEMAVAELASLTEALRASTAGAGTIGTHLEQVERHAAEAAQALSGARASADRAGGAAQALAPLLSRAAEGARASIEAAGAQATTDLTEKAHGFSQGLDASRGELERIVGAFTAEIRALRADLAAR